MAITYDPIATTTLASTSALVTFSSITSAYTDLVLVISATNTSAGVDIFLRMNNDTGTNYSYNWMSSYTGTPATGTVNTTANVRMGYYAIPTTDVEYHSVTHILSYSNAAEYTTWITRANRASQGTEMIAANWRSTSAVNRIDIVANTGAFGIGSTFTLYGIATA